MLTFTNYITRFSYISAGYHASIRITDFCWQGTGTRPAARPFRDSSTMISMALQIQQRYIIQQPSCCFYCFLVMSTYIKTVKPPGMYFKKPLNHRINYLSTGAGFLSSTVSRVQTLGRLSEASKTNNLRHLDPVCTWLFETHIFPISIQVTYEQKKCRCNLIVLDC